MSTSVFSAGVSGTGYNTTGTIQGGTRPDDKRPGTEVFSNGNREGSNNFLYDGIDDNVRTIESIVFRPGIDAIKEFKVQTNLYPADLGRNSGSVIDVVTKSGTNTWHGSAFEFLRNSDVDARSFFNVKPQPFPSFRYNQFGGSLGGPVILPKIYNGKNKTFFFVDYEGYRNSQLNTLVVTIPSLAERSGNFSALKGGIFDPLTTATNPVTRVSTRQQFPGNIIPASRFDPITKILVNAYPIPLTSGLTNNYTANLLQTPRSVTARCKPPPGLATSRSNLKTSRRFDFPEAFGPMMKTRSEKDTSAERKLRQFFKDSREMITQYHRLYL